MPSRLGRFLAPLALVTCAAAVLAIVQISLGDDAPPAPAQRDQGADRERREQDPAPRREERQSYTVRPGDVLSVIAERNDVSVERILELNPDVDPQSLRAGQRLRIRP